MPFAEQVRVARRFQRAVRIDTDLEDPASLDGFACPRSSAEVLETMTRHVAETGQGAFTWTGPYGGGKSSLALALSALLNGNHQKREIAAQTVGKSTANTVWESLPPKDNGWRILPIVGERGSPEAQFGRAINAKKIPGITKHRRWSQEQVLLALSKISQKDPEQSGGLIIFIDEMGKLLEGAVQEKQDIHFLQQLAEYASRSRGRLLVVGILHQAFEEYAHRGSREMRDEWGKIQGRFIDLPVNTGADEQIALIGRAIEIGPFQTEFSQTQLIQTEPRSPELGGLVSEVADRINRPASPDLPDLLRDCWPLHPTVACLLGPISRRRFGQNQRSLFGFLSSAEPRGFQEFLKDPHAPGLYLPERLWDYLKINLEPSIMASPDGHRWALAAEAVEKRLASSEEATDARVLKTVAVIDLFHERSGLSASPRMIELSLPDLAPETVQATLARLRGSSLIVYRKFNDSFSLFEGSDFDVEQELDQVLAGMESLDYQRLNQVANLQLVVAKRHYHETGAMRWFEVEIAPEDQVSANLDNFRPKNGAAGVFLLTVPGESLDRSTRMARLAEAAAAHTDRPVTVGVPPENWNFINLARELLALEQIPNAAPELQGDRVARRELGDRVSDLRGRIASETAEALGNSDWVLSDKFPGRGRTARLTASGLNSLASDLADRTYPKSPRIINELLNRNKPSSNAVAAQNILLRRMVTHEGQERLGIEGFPAEWGIFESVLKFGGLHQQVDGAWRFTEPGVDDPCGLRPLWEDAIEYLQADPGRSVLLSEIQERWRNPSFGVKDGLMPVLSAAFVLSNKRDLALYRRGVFQPRVSDLDMDYLAKDPDDIKLRWMDLTERSRELLAEMAAVVRDLGSENTLTDLEPIDVARGLVAIYDELPHWTGRTQRISGIAKQVRQLFKQANDPNRLIFDEIPSVISENIISEEVISEDDPSRGTEDLKAVSQRLRDGLTELKDAYPVLLERLLTTLLTELQVPNRSGAMMAELRERAQNIRELSGDHRLEAFILRLSQFSGSVEDMENLASMAANKPARSWVDSDIDRTTVEIAEMARKFIRMESLAHVKGRPDRRHSLAVTVGLGGQPVTAHREFDVTDPDRPAVRALVAEVQKALSLWDGGDTDIVLAALAEISAAYIEKTENEGVVL